MTDTPTVNAQKSRPVSPHLQVYRLPLPALSSITHRITGVALTAGTLVLAWWLLSLAGGADSFAAAQAVIGNPLGQLVLLGWTWALWYHTLNGVRHLIWDSGRGLELGTAYRSAAFTFAASIGLTILTWIAAYALK